MATFHFHPDFFKAPNNSTMNSFVQNSEEQVAQWRQIAIGATDVTIKSTSAGAAALQFELQSGKLVPSIQPEYNTLTKAVLQVQKDQRAHMYNAITGAE